MSTESFFLDPALQDYILATALREPDVCARLRRETAELPMARMQIAPEQGQLMALLVDLMGARKTLDIGVFTGYSALRVALALPREGQVVGCDINEDWASIAHRYWQEAGVADKISLRLAPAVETLDELIANGEQGSFDFAFIDADKGGYIDYYERCLKLLRHGGLIAADNVLWSGRVAYARFTDDDTRAIRAFNEHLRDDTRVDICLVPIADGLTLARKR